MKPIALIPEIEGKIIFLKEYRNREALRGLEDFSHIWLLWQFSEAVRDSWSPTVRPPLLGGNRRMGVFATRSPFRPNPIGLSAVKLEKIDYEDKQGPVLYISGCDLMDGTPIYDIKPYLPFADSIPSATGGFTEQTEERTLELNFPQQLLEKIPSYKRKTLCAVLSGDPRPSYQSDADRIYGFSFAEFEISFKVENKKLTVTSVEYRK